MFSTEIRDQLDTQRKKIESLSSQLEFVTQYNHKLSLEAKELRKDLALLLDYLKVDIVDIPAERKILKRVEHPQSH